MDIPNPLDQFIEQNISLTSEQPLTFRKKDTSSEEESVPTSPEKSSAPWLDQHNFVPFINQQVGNFDKRQRSAIEVKLPAAESGIRNYVDDLSTSYNTLLDFNRQHFLS